LGFHGSFSAGALNPNPVDPVILSIIFVEEILPHAEAARAEGILQLVEYAAIGVELLAVAIIVAVIVVGTLVYVTKIVGQQADRSTYNNYRHTIGRALLLGLEILVAADIIRTVVLQPTASNVIVLGLLVVIRTFLSWSLVLEIEERWPWQPRPKVEERGEDDALAVKSVEKV